MTIDEIIDLAQEAGIRITLDWAERPYTTFIKDDGELYLRVADALIHFAALVRNATLEECASEFEGLYTDGCPGTKISAAIRAMKEQA